MFTDIEIAQSCAMQPIAKIADTLGVAPDLLEPYGKYKAKVDYLALKELPQKGKLVLVTAINPTPAGEGKTTVSIGLADALRLEGYNAVPCPARAVARTCVRRKRRRGRRRLCAGRPDGGHQPAFHRRHARHRRGQQPASPPWWITSIQQGNAAEHRPAPHHMETLHGYERPPAPQPHRRTRRKGRTARRARMALISRPPSEIMATLCLASSIAGFEGADRPHCRRPQLRR